MTEDEIKNNSLTELEIKNCKNYLTAKAIVDYWNKPDSEFEVVFNANEEYEGYVYLWRIGNVRWRMVRRAPWQNLSFCRY